MLNIESSELLKMRYRAIELSYAKKNIFSSLMGSLNTKRRGRGMEFHQARPYVYGDDVRSIDWRITARKTKAHTREFQQDNEQPLFLIIDQSINMRFASVGKLKSVIAAEISALIGWACLNQNDRFGALVLNQKQPILKPTLSVRRYCHFLGKLSEATTDLSQPLEKLNHAEKSWQQAILFAGRLIPTGSRLILIGDLTHLQTSDWQTLKSQSGRFQINGIHIYDPLELSLPPIRTFLLNDGKQTFSLEKANTNQEKRYQQKLQHVRSNFRKINGNLRTCMTNQEIEEVL